MAPNRCSLSGMEEDEGEGSARRKRRCSLSGKEEDEGEGSALRKRRCSLSGKEEDEGEGSALRKRRRSRARRDTENRRLLLHNKVDKLIENGYSNEAKLAQLAQRIEEIQELLANLVNKGEPVHQNECFKYRLQFQNKLNDELFTNSKIEANDGSPVQIAIFDIALEKIVMSGPFSSVEVELIVLDSDGVEVRPRPRKGTLLKGGRNIKMTNGVANLTDVTFTDNSSWTRDNQFRLGVALSQSENICNEVQQGKSEPFTVKEARGKERSKKRHPSLGDEVWRLKGISKDGPYCKYLEDIGITTVQNFLMWYHTDQPKLRNMFPRKAKIPWEDVVKHAKECDVGNKLYSRLFPEKNCMLFFFFCYTCVFHVFVFPILQILVETLKKSVHQDINSIRLADLDHEMIDGFPRPLPTNGFSFPGSSSFYMQVGEQQTVLPENGNSHGPTAESYFELRLRSTGNTPEPDPSDYQHTYVALSVLLTMSEDEMRTLAAQLTRGKWVNIMAALKLLFFTKLSVSKRARLSCPD